MAKLYWRVKRDGKWTWTPATMYNDDPDEHRPLTLVYTLGEEE